MSLRSSYFPLFLPLLLLLLLLAHVSIGDLSPSSLLSKSSNRTKLHVTAVYHAAIDPDYEGKWAIIEGQMKDARDHGLFGVLVEFHVILCTAANRSLASTETLKEGRQIIDEIVQNATRVVYYWHYDVRNEFHSLYIFRSLADDSVHPDSSVILYFHTKGMYNHHPSFIGRTPMNIRLTDRVIKQVPYILNEFARNVDLDIAGLAPSCVGFVWFNFFWARARVWTILVCFSLFYV